MGKNRIMEARRNKGRRKETSKKIFITSATRQRGEGRKKNMKKEIEREGLENEIEQRLKKRWKIK